MLRIFFAAIVVLIGGVAHAERRVALVIGIDEYKSIGKLDNPVDDAQAFGDTLKALEFEVTLELNRDLRRLRRALEDFRMDAAGADVALIFFAGHGVEILGENRLLPTDTDASSLETLKASTLPLEEVRETVAAVAKVGLIVLDACRNDPFGVAVGGSNEGGPGRSATAVAQDVIEKAKPGLGRVGRAEGILFAFAAAPGETASDGSGGHSPFTAALVKYFGTEGIEVRSALTLIQQEVYDLSRGKQLPYIENGMPALFFAAPTKEERPERERLLLAMAEITPELRTEVERIAAEKDMPLAPLYAALISTDIRAMTPVERGRRLEEAAGIFVAMQAEARMRDSDDQEVTRLRQEAEKQLRLGAIETARATLNAAIGINSNLRKTFKKQYLSGWEGYVASTLSEAAMRVQKGDVAAVGLHYRDAIVDYEAAAALYDEVSGNIPDNDQRLRARALWSLGDMLLNVGNLGAAREAYGKSRDLLTAPSAEAGDERRQRDLALVFSRIGDIEWTAGDAGNAVEAYDASLDIYRKLYESEPGNAQAGGNLWIAYSKVGDARLQTRDLAEALLAYDQAQEIVDRLAAQYPGDPKWKDASAFLSERIADARNRYSTPEELIRVYQGNLKVRQQLAATDPSNVEKQDSLSIAYERVSQILAKARQTDAATSMIEEAVRIRKSLAAQDPQNLWRQRRLASGYQNLGLLQRERLDLPASLASFEAALILTRTIAAADPGNAAWQNDLVGMQDLVADARIATGNPSGAIEMRQASIDVIEARLAGRAGGDYEARIDLARRYAAIGDLRTANGVSDLALDNYRKSLSIQTDLAGQYPTDSRLKKDIATSLTNIGHVLEPRSRREALTSFESGHQILKDLAEQEPGNAQRQLDLIWSHRELALLGIRPEEHLKQALAMAASLRKAHRLSDDNAFVIDLLNEDISIWAQSK